MMIKVTLNMDFLGYLQAVLDVFYPRHCLSCNRNLNNSSEFYLCKECKDGISYVKGTCCYRCGNSLGPYVSDPGKEGCAMCKGKVLHSDSLTYVASYSGVMKQLIHKFKYARLKYLSKTLNEFVLAQKKFLIISPDIDVIVPVPLHWMKKLYRGFNQAEMLSIEIHKCISKPLSKNNLCRIKITKSQTKLSKSKRQENMSNAFLVKDPKEFYNKKILLVDDVVTTGVTLQECSKKLKEAGAVSIHLLVLASAEYNN